MNEIILKLQREAERIASRHPLPEFYTRFKAPLTLAKKLLYSDPDLIRLRKSIEPVYHEELGHGLLHSVRVSIDCAGLLFIETVADRMEPAAVERLMFMGLFSGLLHDICRHEEQHAECGAREAQGILRDYSLNSNEVLCITNAIRNHEAFTPCESAESRWMQLVSDCLYDADKFRWGSDTFTHTLWYMADHQGLSPTDLIKKFPWGMSGTVAIAETFRTPTGRQYGPEIIETGVEIGKEIYRYLLQHYREV
ncbi:MAG: hypothetical protein AB9866_25500 [Syntrophobacteraceae bacterium]